MTVKARFPTLRAYIRAAVGSSDVRRYSVPTEEAMEVLGVTRGRISQLVQAGRLDCVEVHLAGRSGYLFDMADLQKRNRSLGVHPSGGLDTCLEEA